MGYRQLRSNQVKWSQIAYTKLFRPTFTLASGNNSLFTMKKALPVCDDGQGLFSEIRRRYQVLFTLVIIHIVSLTENLVDAHPPYPNLIGIGIDSNINLVHHIKINVHKHL